MAKLIQHIRAHRDTKAVQYKIDRLGDVSQIRDEPPFLHRYEIKSHFKLRTVRKNQGLLLIGCGRYLLNNVHATPGKLRAKPDESEMLDGGVDTPWLVSADDCDDNRP